MGTQSYHNRNTCTAYTCLYLTSIEIEILRLPIYMDRGFHSISNEFLQYGKIIDHLLSAVEA